MCPLPLASAVPVFAYVTNEPVNRRMLPVLEISKLFNFIISVITFWGFLTVKLKGNNILKVLEVPQKALPQEKMPITVHKIPEPPPAKGTCQHY